MKRTYSATFKAQVVLELLKETKTLNQLASEHSIHPNVLRSWRDQAVQDFASLFERRDARAAEQAAHDKHLDELYAEIGRLTIQPSRAAWARQARSCSSSPTPCTWRRSAECVKPFWTGV